MNSSNICLSCGNSFTGTYCNNCGEKIVKPDDRKLIYFFRELVNTITFADNKFWRTFKTILLNPGKFSSDYVEGRRIQYMKPTGVFFLANLIYFLFPLINTFTTSLDLQTSAFFYSDIARNMINNFLYQQALDYEEFKLLYDTKTAELSKLLLILMAFILSFFFSIIHIGSKKKFMVDHITISLEIVTFVLIFGIEVLSVLLILLSIVFDLEFLFTNYYLTGMILILLTYYFIRMEANFYGFKKFRLIINTLLCLISISLTLMIYRGLLFFITYWSIA